MRSEEEIQERLKAIADIKNELKNEKITPSLIIYLHKLLNIETALKWVLGEIEYLELD